MGLLAPLFLLGAAAIAVPVIIHMIQRERKEVIEFPSLMFVRRIPFHSFRRQRIRNWPLLLLRCAALLLLMLAFARPFFQAGALAGVTSGAREVVIMLDRSYSMGYGDRWDRAKAAVEEVVDRLGAEDRATIIFFDSGAQAGPRSTTNRASLTGLVADAELSAGSTRFGPALKLAEGIFEDSNLPFLEAVLVSDFQRLGVESAMGVRFPEGTVLTPISLASPDGDEIENVSVAGVLFQREYFSGRERVVVAARVTNRGNQPVERLDVTLSFDGRDIETLTTDLPPHGSSTVDFAAVTLGDAPMTGIVRTEPDALPTDDVFHFVVSPGQVVRVLVIGNERGGERGGDADLYLRRALGIGSSPAFDVVTTRVDTFTASDLDGRQVVILNDSRPPVAQAGRALATFVEQGGGLLVVSGERSTWPADGPDLLPGTIGSPVDRDGRGGSIGFVDYSHPVFELFSAPRSGDVTTARFFRYRPVELHDTATVLARFDDGRPALTERQVGAGRVLLWGSTLDSFWNDLALKPVYLPFVHRLTEHLAGYTPPTPWFSTGQVLDLSDQKIVLGTGGLEAAEFIAISPSGRRISVSEGDRAGFLELDEQGRYEVRDATSAETAPLMVAVNVDLAESDLTPVDPEELASTVTGRAGGEREAAALPVREIGADDLERRQSIWWYLLVAAFLFFVTETLVSNRVSRTALNAPGEPLAIGRVDG